MPFDYYQRLSATQRRIYDRSNGVSEVRLAPSSVPLAGVATLRTALEGGKRAEVQRAAAKLVGHLAASLGVEPVDVKVLSVRPRSRASELHGLYVRERGKRPLLTVWMRTAAHRRIAAFRTFLRTLLHEFCHHLDYALLKLPDSLHTEGFFQRESSLMRQITAPEAPRKPALPPRAPAQLELPFARR
jgi:hypothetical protein